MNNLSKALPHLDSSQKNAIINGMWDNLGRVVGEFPHVCKMSADQILQHVEIDENSKKILDELIAKKQIIGISSSTSFLLFCWSTFSFCINSIVALLKF